ncbi:hypothetical protein [Kitasatospora sp. NPDC085879]|uniref:hypothetical protein n=1 Tax=Kitasatospora sp. NPDC085879 TaxID=3154769 RepID=UPI000BB11D00|nr:hypothetical protein [Streptomyces sp. TLI_235]PBC78524.1 hypothetical protein BX265_3296 [Streptomyces sp. TLI_235]
MTDAPHLLAEDRPDYERILDEALRDGTILEALREPEPHLNTEQLRTKAMLNAGTVAAAAAPEYRHYLGLREDLRRSAAPGGERGGLGGELSGRLRSDEGAGLFPVLTVLAPVLSWSAAALLLAIGYALRAARPALPLGRSVVTAGWAAIAVGTAAMAVGIVGLLLTALRDSSAGPAGQDPNLAADVAEARRAWHTALRERALLPYLYDNLGSAPALSPQPTGRPVPPDLLSPGYSRPGYSSAGFTSPGVEGLTDQEGREPRTAEFTSPGYTPPGFTGPDEVSS